MNEQRPAASRRGFFLGASAVGAGLAASALLPATPTPQAVLAPRPVPERGGGYALTERVQQYYRSARV